MAGERAARWAGVDVGGLRKGFDAAVIDDAGIVAGPTRLESVDATVEWLNTHSPRVVAVDSPRAPAPGEALSREGERRLAAAVCGIRYTPNRSALEANPSYYGWILNGFDLYEALKLEAQRAGWTVIECFPTASWTRLAEPRGKRRRAAWTRAILDGLGVEGLPPRTNQDARDAIAAALTARLYETPRSAETFGDIVVPAAGAVLR
ncbi:MAG: DUF429 domain-containing protein [Actinomycetota bacterium]|nr:DUF429 domain-containing protein [Actinomycetota bacterium]